MGAIIRGERAAHIEGEVGLNNEVRTQRRVQIIARRINDIGVQHHGVNRTIRAGATVEGGINVAIGREPNDAVLGLAVDLGEFTAGHN